MKTPVNVLLAFVVSSASTAAAFAATVERDPGVQTGNWSDASSWMGGQLPLAEDFARLAGGTSTIIDSGEITVDQVSIIDSDLTISGGSLTCSGPSVSKLFLWGGEINISGSSTFKASTVSVGNYNTSNSQIVGVRDSVVNIFGDASLTLTNMQAGFNFGGSALDKDVSVNIYENATVSGGRFLLGSTLADSVAKTSVSVSGGATVGTDYVNLYKNTTLTLSGNARINASQALRAGDMNQDSATKNSVSLSGNAVLAAAGSKSSIFDDAVVTVSENAALTVNGLELGNDPYSNRSSGTLILSGSARFYSASNVVLFGGSEIVVEGSNLRRVEGMASHINALGSSSFSDQSGTVRFVADENGISTLVCDYMAYVDADARTGYELVIDFTNLALGEGTYEFGVISTTRSDSRELSIIAAYANSDSNLVEIIKANDADSYELLLSADGKTFSISYTHVPEPAACAAIFGALALALAACGRRR